jgi:hypothetical protein
MMIYFTLLEAGILLNALLRRAVAATTWRLLLTFLPIPFDALPHITKEGQWRQ